MRRMILLAGLIFALGVLLPGSASTSTTYHGKFTSAVGVTTSGEVVPWNVFGTWNVDGTRLTGLEAHVPPPVACDGIDFRPVPFPLVRFEMTGSWSNGVYTAHGDVGVPGILYILLTFTLDPTATPPVTAVGDIQACPYADWKQFTYYGDLLP